MTPAAPGVLLRHPGEARPLRWRRRREPQDEFHVEAADAAMREADEHKLIAIRLRSR